jgi:hypothetical protein
MMDGRKMTAFLMHSKPAKAQPKARPNQKAKRPDGLTRSLKAIGPGVASP